VFRRLLFHPQEKPDRKEESQHRNADGNNLQNCGAHGFLTPLFWFFCFGQNALVSIIALNKQWTSQECVKKKFLLVYNLLRTVERPFLSPAGSPVKKADCSFILFMIPYLKTERKPVWRAIR